MIQPKKIETSINEVSEAWEELAPDKSFAGMTLPQFQAKVQLSLDSRKKLSGAKDQRISAQSDRARNDAVSRETLLLVVNAIKGDPTEGEDSALYEACGYIPKSKRKSGLSRKAKTAEALIKPV